MPSRRLTSLIALLAFLLPPSGVLAGAEAPRRVAERGTRALWIWRPTFLEDHQDYRELLQFTRKRRIRTLFLFVSTRRLEEKPEAFRRFLERAHREKLVVHALNGDPEWTLREKRHEARAFLNAVSAFNRISPPAGRFDAVHLDVEPQSLPQWTPEAPPQIKQGLAGQYVDFLTWARRKTQEEGLPLSVDIPMAFSSIQMESRPLLAEVVQLVDEVAVMAYLDEAAEVLAGSRAPLDQATRAGKTVWVGLSADPEHLPPVKPGKKLEPELEKLARQVERSLAGRPAFRGVAVHDYDHYRRAQCKSLEACQPSAPAAPANSAH
jgi:hypothetical protein